MSGVQQSRSGVCNHSQKATAPFGPLLVSLWSNFFDTTTKALTYFLCRTRICVKKPAEVPHGGALSRAFCSQGGSNGRSDRQDKVSTEFLLFVCPVSLLFKALRLLTVMESSHWGFSVLTPECLYVEGRGGMENEGV